MQKEVDQITIQKNVVLLVCNTLGGERQKKLEKIQKIGGVKLGGGAKNK
jgi:serine acetyltransferase